jgi:hypothetical protein
MRIFHCPQRSEEWDRLRARPTASEFGSIVTPVKGDYSASATKYAAKIVAKRLEVYVENPPSYWMEWGTEQEDNAIHAYESLTGFPVDRVGFIMPDDHDGWGGSPDALVNPDGLLEVKCPAPETLVAYHAGQALPMEYRAQVQGLLMISERKWCDFFAFHPQLTPFMVRVLADEQYQEKIREGLEKLLEEIARIESLVSPMEHEIIAPVTEELRWTS